MLPIFNVAFFFFFIKFSQISRKIKRLFKKNLRFLTICEKVSVFCYQFKTLCFFFIKILLNQVNNLKNFQKNLLFFDNLWKSKCFLLPFWNIAFLFHTNDISINAIIFIELVMLIITDAVSCIVECEGKKNIYITIFLENYVEKNSIFLLIHIFFFFFFLEICCMRVKSKKKNVHLGKPPTILYVWLNLEKKKKKKKKKQRNYCSMNSFFFEKKIVFFLNFILLFCRSCS